MRSYRLTPAAHRDLSGIWDFTKERWDAGRAEKYLTEIQAAIERIAADPDRGRACGETRPGYHRYSIGSHLVVFTVSSDTVDVVRTLHQRMDPTRHL